MLTAVQKAPAFAADKWKRRSPALVTTGRSRRRKSIDLNMYARIREEGLAHSPRHGVCRRVCRTASGRG